MGLDVVYVLYLFGKLSFSRVHLHIIWNKHYLHPATYYQRSAKQIVFIHATADAHLDLNSAL